MINLVVVENFLFGKKYIHLFSPRNTQIGKLEKIYIVIVFCFFVLLCYFCISILFTVLISV